MTTRVVRVSPEQHRRFADRLNGGRPFASAEELVEAVAAEADRLRMSRQVRELEADVERLRHRQVEAKVDEAIAERRIPTGARDVWVRRFEASEELAVEMMPARGSVEAPPTAEDERLFEALNAFHGGRLS